MLLELDIRDFAIIERTLIRFSDGLNALTGETGAGKSILLDALGAVLGARVSNDLIRTGAVVARVEAAFAVAPTDRQRLTKVLEENGVEIDHDNVLILGREILANGRSGARINGRLATAGALREIGGLLVDIHGQSDHLAILKESEQRNLLDRFAGLESDRLGLAELVRNRRELRRRIAELSRGVREREQRLDLLRYQASEIEAASLVVGEDTALATERDVLRNADQLRASALSALALILGSDDADPVDIATRLRQVTALTGEISSLDASLRSLDERAKEVLVLVEDLGRELRSYADTVESDEQRLAEVEDRLDLIQTLRRKYGPTIEEIVEFGHAARAELEAQASGEHNVEELQERLKGLEVTIGMRASDLSARRQEAAARLSQAIMESVAELAMGSATVEVSVTQRDDPEGIALEQSARRVSVDETGVDRVEYRIAANAGEVPKPLARVASGGETARLMLALKSILSDVDLTPTLVFDEIDVGIGGRSGQVVGEKLWNIARSHQVVVVTHLPQIASIAGTHLRIEKETASGRTSSHVRDLGADERVHEIAAMLDGAPVTESARQSAREMLDRSRRYVEAIG